MPCSSWTTGSPMRTSDRSRTIASTFERAPGVALAAAHDVRVELGFGDEREPRGGPREARVQRRRGQRDLRVARDEMRRTHSTTAGRTPYSAKYCCIVSRRPALSAQISIRPSSASSEALSAASGSSARRSTCTDGSRRTGRVGVDSGLAQRSPADRRRAQTASATAKLVVRQEELAAAAAAAAPCRRASAGSATRCPARSARRAASTSPCSATTASRGK